MEDVTTSVHRYAVLVGPSSHVSPRKTVVVHTALLLNACGSLFNILGGGGINGVEVILGVVGTRIAKLSVVVSGLVVVRVSKTVLVLHPVWQVEHWPTTVLVPVVSQHGSSGGTYEVLVDTVMQFRCGKQL